MILLILSLLVIGAVTGFLAEGLTPHIDQADRAARIEQPDGGGTHGRVRRRPRGSGSAACSSVSLAGRSSPGPTCRSPDPAVRERVPMSLTDAAAEQQPPRGHVRSCTWGRSPPTGRCARTSATTDGRRVPGRVLARLLLLPPHDPQFRRNRERVVRDAERENILLEWDLGLPERTPDARRSPTPDTWRERGERVPKGPIGERACR